MLICGPGFDEGSTFIHSFGIFQNASIAHGIPKGSLVYRKGQVLFDACNVLLEGIQRDFDLITHDYSYRIGDGDKQYGGGQSIVVNNRRGILSLRPKGYCSIQFVTGSEPRLIDLRPHKTYMSDDGEIKIYRRTAQSNWLSLLQSAIGYLQPRLAKELSLEHIDKVI